MVGGVMKASRRIGNLNIRLAGLLLAGVFAGSLAVRAQTDTSPPSGTTSALMAAPQYSAGIADVVKMVQAKVDMAVIKAYIQNSPVSYNPSATEIIALKSQGISDDLVTAILQRGAEVRTELAKTQSTPPPAAAAPYSPTYSSSGYGYDYPSADYSYADYGMPYGYPYGYGYGWGPPYYGYPYYSVGFPLFFDGFFFDHFGHRHFRDFDRFGRGFDRDDRFGGFDNRFGRFGNFRSPNFRGISRSPFSPAVTGRAFGGVRTTFGARPAFSGGMRTGGFGGGRAMGGGGHR